MSINVERADDKELGDYRTYVTQIRGNDGLLSDDLMITFMHITPSILLVTRQILAEHPDWDDEEVAEEVLNIVD